MLGLRRAVYSRGATEGTMSNYRIRSRVAIPAYMQGEMPIDTAFGMVCAWNDVHKIDEMVWLERVDAAQTATEEHDA